MTWLQRYRIRHYVANSIWILPSLSIVAALGAVRLLDRIERIMGWAVEFNPETARAVLGTMAASMFTFIVFVSSALLVAVQLASSQLTPRIIAIVFRDPVTRFSLTVFVFTFTFTLATLVRIDASVPLRDLGGRRLQLPGELGRFSLPDRPRGQGLRPSGALRSVPCWAARSSRTCIRGVWVGRRTRGGGGIG